MVSPFTVWHCANGLHCMLWQEGGWSRGLGVERENCHPVSLINTSGSPWTWTSSLTSSTTLSWLKGPGGYLCRDCIKYKSPPPEPPSLGSYIPRPNPLHFTMDSPSFLSAPYPVVRRVAEAAPVGFFWMWSKLEETEPLAGSSGCRLKSHLPPTHGSTLPPSYTGLERPAQVFLFTIPKELWGCSVHLDVLT